MVLTENIYIFNFTPAKRGRAPDVPDSAPAETISENSSDLYDLFLRMGTPSKSICF